MNCKIFLDLSKDSSLNIVLLIFSSSWNEHLFEISLPRSCCIGHIDFKFSLHPSFSSLPNIQATLLKQNTGGIVKKDASDEGSIKHPIMSSTSCKSKSCVDQENPVLSREFLDTHNAEILCGPLSLASYLDLSCQSGIVTFTSPKLMETKSRTFIIHLKALRNGEDKLQLRHQLQQSGKREVSVSVADSQSVNYEMFICDIYTSNVYSMM